MEILIRIVLSPLVFLYSIFLLAALTLFPLPLLTGFSLFGMMSVPFVWLFRKGGGDLDYIEPFIGGYEEYKRGKNIFRNHFFGATIYIWGAFGIVYYYIKTGRIFAFEE